MRIAWQVRRIELHRLLEADQRTLLPVADSHRGAIVEYLVGEQIPRFRIVGSLRQILLAGLEELDVRGRFGIARSRERDQERLIPLAQSRFLLPRNSDPLVTESGIAVPSRRKAQSKPGQGKGRILLERSFKILRCCLGI